MSFCSRIFANFYVRDPKNQVLHTNQREVEKVLLRDMAFKHTMRFVLTGGLDNNPNQKINERIEIIKEIRHKCPSLLDSVLAFSERNAFLEQLDENESALELVGSKEHLKPLALKALPKKTVIQVYDLPVAIHKLPRDSRIIQQLFVAYANDYGMKEESSLATKSLQWCRSFSFTDV